MHSIMRSILGKHIGVNTRFSFKGIGLVVIIIILVVVVQWRNSNFLSLENINDLLRNTAILAILVMGMSMVIIIQGIDLSIGSTLALTGMSVALLTTKYSFHPILALILGIVIGAICGLLVGLIIAKGKVIPIIATLGMMSVYRGITYLISGGAWVSAHQMPTSFKNIATKSIMGINHLVFIAMITIVVSFYFLSFTRTGRKIYAVGNNRDSARISGINVDNITLLVYVIMGVLAGMAGVLWVSKFASAQGNTATGYELTVIAACVLGGVSITGGVGKMSTILTSVLLLGILQNALPLVNVSPFWQSLIQGLVIIIAVIVNVLFKRQGDYQVLKRRLV